MTMSFFGRGHAVAEFAAPLDVILTAHNGARACDAGPSLSGREKKRKVVEIDEEQESDLAKERVNRISPRNGIVVCFRGWTT